MARTRPWAVLLGTRPEIIKMSPVIREIQKKRLPLLLIHSGQHYSPQMDGIFFKKLGLPKPNVQLNTGTSGKTGHGAQTAHILEGVEAVLKKSRPEVLFVQGDTNTVVAGALAACKIPGIRVAHVEAGLRSYDRNMPEESNRVVTDHLSDFLFAPTRPSADILKGEGIDPHKIFVTGNTIVDAVRQNLSIALRKASRLRPGLTGPAGYGLLTLHRQENVDHRDRLAQILEGLERTAEHCGLRILFPVHPRTRKQLAAFGLRLPAGVVTIEPVDFLEFLALQKRARLLLTDSGGVQEEGCILGVPCVTLRTTTERPETLRAGANLLAGHDPQKILRASVRMLANSKKWKNPFGDGRSAERMIRIVKSALSA